MMNYTTIINNIAGWMNNVGVGISPSMLLWLVPVAFIIGFFLVWIALRSIRLWYWKTNAQISTLDSIDKRLKAMEDELHKFPDLIGDGPDAKIETDAEKEWKEAHPLEESLEPIEGQEEKSIVDFFHTGRSGRVYTEEELLLQIKE